MIKNTAGQKIGAQMITAADGTIFTGAVTVYVTGDAGTQALGSVGSGVCVNEGNGYSTYAPAQAETNYSLVAFTFIGTGAISTTVQVFTQIVQQTVDNNIKIDLLQTDMDTLVDDQTLPKADYTIVSDLGVVQSADNNTILTNATYGNAAIRTRGDIAWITGAGGSAPTVEQIAAEVWDTLIASHVGVTTFGGKNQKVVPSETLNDYKATGFNTVIPPTEAQMNARTRPTADYFDQTTDEVTTDAASRTASKADVSNLDAAISTRATSAKQDTMETTLNGVPTTAEFNARTIVSADYVVVGDTIAGVTTVTNLTNAPTSGDLTANMKASVNTEVDTALNTAIPGSPTAASINDYMRRAKYAVCNRWDIVEASGNLEVFDDGGVSFATVAAAFTTLAGTTLRKKIL